MSKKLTNDQSKIDLVARLVKDGAIDFVEAIKLLEVEAEIKIQKEYIPQLDYQRWLESHKLFQLQRKNPLDPPYEITCGTGISPTGTIQYESLKNIPFTYTN
jgi:hypothetical protein